MSSAEKTRKLFAKSRVTVNSKVDDRIISDTLTAFSKSSETKLISAEPNTWRIVLNSRITKVAAAVVIIIAVLIGIHQFSGSIESVAWASVAERFRSAPFFNATIYFKQDATAQPEQVELWMNQEGFARLRYDNQVVFSKKGKVTKAFDLETRSEIEPDQRAVTLVHLMGDAESFSLETVIRGISGGELVDVTPLVNTDAVISEDLVVFDVESEKSSQWFRIWALRESKLPVRIRMWDPRDGECADVLLTYSKQQQEIFFDPEAFSSKIKNFSDKKINLAYMFLKDPGGKQVFPGSLNESEAFSVVTQTIDGQPWSLADHRGKVILIILWDKRTIGTSWVSHSKDIYERFRDHADFLMVGVALDAKAETVKDYCRNKGIKWLQLHEPGKKRENSLAQAFGIGFRRSAWLIKKDGSMEELFALEEGVIEGALVGLTYDSYIWIRQILSKVKQEGILTRETVEQICGKPHSVNKTDKGEGWDFTLFNKDKSAVRGFHIDFDKAGNCLRWYSAR